MQPAMSRSLIAASGKSSVDAITDLVMGRLTKTWPVMRHPFGHPVDHCYEAGAWRTEQTHRLRCIGQPRRRRFRADGTRLFPEARTEFLRQPPHRDGLWSRYIDRRRRRRHMAQAAQRQRIGVALPDYVDMAHGDVDRLIVAHLAGDVEQNAVAHVDCVIQPEQPAGRAISLRKIVEHALTADARTRIVARAGEPRKCSATKAGTCTFIAQVSAGLSCAPNLRPAMKMTLRSCGSFCTAARSSRSQAMVSTPCACSVSHSPASLKRATPMTRLSGAALRASRARVGPILPPTPSTMMSPSSAARSAPSARLGRVRNSSSSSGPSNRGGNGASSSQGVMMRAANATYSAAWRGGARIVSSPSAALAEIVVRTM